MPDDFEVLDECHSCKQKSILLETLEKKLKETDIVLQELKKRDEARDAQLLHLRSGMEQNTALLDDFSFQLKLKCAELQNESNTKDMEIQRLAKSLSEAENKLGDALDQLLAYKNIQPLVDFAEKLAKLDDIVKCEPKLGQKVCAWFSTVFGATEWGVKERELVKRFNEAKEALPEAIRAVVLASKHIQQQDIIVHVNNVLSS